eukprot:m.213393 g.213393  ORF g.213393 m.213393 type:complete len:306 (+) comp26562_c0_seq1:60-977(+)
MARTRRRDDNAGEFSLSPYEQQRTPHTMITDDRIVSLPMKELDAELVCPICLTLCSGTMTTMDCVHRFCGNCIMKSIRFDNRDEKKCPTCRKAIPSGHRSLRQDLAFENIIDNIYPDRQVYDEFEDEVQQRVRKFSNLNALTASMQEGMRQQAAQRTAARYKAVSPKEDTDATTSAPASASSPGTGPAGAVSSIRVELRRAPIRQDALLPVPTIRERYLRVPPSCYVAHIVQYVACATVIKHVLPLGAIQIHCAHGSAGVAVAVPQYSSRWHKERPMCGQCAWTMCVHMIARHLHAVLTVVALPS